MMDALGKTYIYIPVETSPTYHYSQDNNWVSLKYIYRQATYPARTMRQVRLKNIYTCRQATIITIARTMMDDAYIYILGKTSQDNMHWVILKYKTSHTYHYSQDNDGCTG